MRIATSPQLLNTGREDREARIRDFVAAALVIRRASGNLEPVTFTLLVRAPDSPAARVIAAMAGELESAGVSVNAVLLDVDTYTEEPGRPSILDMKNADLRVLSDARFTAAHEQLVLSGHCMWLGDCMRRDPSKRDAFEMFHHDNADATNHAAISFSRIWACAQTLRRLRPLAPQMMVAGTLSDAAVNDPQRLPRR